MVGAILTGADLSDANLRSTNLTGADLRGADLTGAILTGADLSDADLTRAILTRAILTRANLSDATLSDAEAHGCIGDGARIGSLQAGTYEVTWFDDTMQIGCQRHPLADWWSFDDERISGMDARALDWWRTWKPVLQSIVNAWGE